MFKWNVYLKWTGMRANGFERKKRKWKIYSFMHAQTKKNSGKNVSKSKLLYIVWLVSLARDFPLLLLAFPFRRFFNTEPLHSCVYPTAPHTNISEIMMKWTDAAHITHACSHHAYMLTYMWVISREQHLVLSSVSSYFTLAVVWRFHTSTLHSVCCVNWKSGCLSHRLVLLFCVFNSKRKIPFFCFCVLAVFVLPIYPSTHHISEFLCDSFAAIYSGHKAKNIGKKACTKRECLAETNKYRHWQWVNVQLTQS